MLDYLSTKLRNCGAEIKIGLGNFINKIKSSLRTPCFCIAAMAVFLFVFIPLSCGLFLELSENKNGFPFIFDSPEINNLFIGTTRNFSLEPPEFLLVGGVSLKASSPPNTFSSQVLGSLVAGAYYEEEEERIIITEYIVEEGDSLWSLSSKFNISLKTILWANDLTEKSIIKPGDKLIILPVSGTVHHVKSGDTISEIAQTYKGKTSEIVAFNRLASENDIYIGDILVVPEGIMPAPSIQKKQSPANLPLANSYFIAPVTSSYIITQGLHWYNAIDFSHVGNACGKPILAAAAGEVLKVAITSSTSRLAFGGAGNHITILHPNGVVTMYGHISASLVSQGDKVSQGDVIALMGGQPGTPGAGLSTGCHLHFGVVGAKNPFAK
jgi:LysM repeat protein